MLTQWHKSLSTRDSKPFPISSDVVKLYRRNVSRRQTKKAQAAAQRRIATTTQRAYFPHMGNERPFINFDYVRACVCVCTHTHTYIYIYISWFCPAINPKLHLTNPASVRHEQWEGTKLTDQIIPRQGMTKFRISLNQPKSVLKTNIKLLTNVNEKEMSYFKYSS
jgi:hypothetical protein